MINAQKVRNSIPNGTNLHFVPDEQNASALYPWGFINMSFPQ